MKFEPGITCKNSSERGLWFIFEKDNLLHFKKDNKIYIPEIISPSEIGVKTTEPLYLGKANSINCWAAKFVLCENNVQDCCGSALFYFDNLRALFLEIGEDMFALAGRALQLINWHTAWKHCPSCSSKLGDCETERAKICTACSSIYYPVISPAIIVAVSKENKLLLAHNKNYPNKKRFSILAGFVEAGESLEQTVLREVKEEVGITVKNIKYFGSQSWPFPHSLMVGFTADYESGELLPDGAEIEHADWYSAGEFPEIPPHGSISRKLIDNFLKNNS
jgi:NAD+ diphosphatase